MGPPLVDEDWHAICQAIYKGVVGPEWENMYNKNVEMHTAVNLKKPGTNKNAKMLWALKDAYEKGENNCDPSSERQIESGASVRQALWEAHMKCCKGSET